MGIPEKYRKYCKYDAGIWICFNVNQGKKFWKTDHRVSQILQNEHVNLKTCAIDVLQ